MTNRREKNKPRNTLNKHLEPRVKEKNEGLIQLGKFFYSLSGLTYAGVVLNYIIHFDKDEIVILYIGALAMAVLAITAWILVKRGNIRK